MLLGIDALAFAVPEFSLDLQALAEARGVPPSKFVDGIGVEQMAIAGPDEDTVTLAIRAGAAALAQAGLTGADVGYLVVGTETAVDHSKPVSSYVHSALDIRASCRVFETKHACFGATAGLLGALEWIAAGNGSQRERVALVIASDIARYGLNTPGEPTQGGAAVAMVVRASPRLLALESPVGHFAKDVHDFWRPLPSKDALVDGAYSVTCYLDALRFAFEDYIDEVQSEAAREFARFDRMIYHVPYGKMAHKAHRHLCEIVEESDPSASFDAKVRPSLAFPKRVGNSYTGSLYLALASLLANDAELEKGTGRIALFSYGSGCGAAFFAGVAVPGAHARMKDVGAVLGAQKAITVREYEELFRARESIDTRPWSPSEGSTGRIRYLGVREGKRIYG